MDDYLENCATENGILRRKLQSKSEALLILTKELEECRSERDQFKMIGEQVQNRTQFRKTNNEQVPRLTLYQSLPNTSSDHILEVREQNKALRYEIQDLKQKLRDAYGDIKVLRAGNAEGPRACPAKEATPAHQREELVEQLERMGVRVGELEAEVRAAHDDRDELEREREEYRAKVLRLNHHLNTLLRPAAECSRIIDLDSLVMDKKYLQEQVQQLQREKDMALQAVVKYKSMLEKKRTKGIVKLGSQNSSVIVSHRQAQELLERGGATADELRSLTMALLDALHDKNVALAHQKKANKILASRNSDLEQRLLSGKGMPKLQLPDNETHVLQNDDLKQDLPTEENCRNAENTSTEILDQLPSTEECGYSENDDSLPEDIQKLVENALKEIYEESMANSQGITNGDHTT